MYKEIKTIGVLTSGGDAPGMNAAVRAVVRTALSKGIKVIGIQRGYNGLLNGEVREMDLRSVSEIIHRGGTVLYTARCLEFVTAEGQKKGAEKCKELGIDAMVVIGGDGSFKGARALANLGIPCIGIPGTIDNDIACSEYTIGYDTAMNTAVEAIDKLRDTTQSHDRCSVVEVMGHHAGYIALNVGIATGALAVLLPEIPFDTDKFLNRPALVSVSNTSGTAGIAYWINAYYKLTGERQVDKNSELVRRLKDWVDKEYEDGRVTVLTDEELVAKIDSVCDELHMTL